jgi:hypothetical protein
MRLRSNNAANVGSKVDLFPPPFAATLLISTNSSFARPDYFEIRIILRGIFSPSFHAFLKALAIN